MEEEVGRLLLSSNTGNKEIEKRKCGGIQPTHSWDDQKRRKMQEYAGKNI